MNEIIIENNIKIENMIYEIRGKQVMLDRDLAKLYNCSNGTKSINLAIKRNIERFPEDFYFQLTYDEYDYLTKKYSSRFQFETLDNESKRGKNLKYLPYVFTEEGVSMLASVLRTKVASYVSVEIMRAFVKMRKYISNNLLNNSYYNDMVIRHDGEIKLLQESFNMLNNNKNNNGLFFEGQIYDSYSLLIDILNTANNNIIIIDNYIDKSILDVLKNINKNITIVTNKYNNEDYIKYKEQYKNINLIINNKIHDRFIIIDDKTLYHSGASFKDLGIKCFAIVKIENLEWLDRILKEIC